MNLVISMDISKDGSHGQVFLERGKPYKGTFQFEHTREGWRSYFKLFKMLNMLLDYVLCYFSKKLGITRVPLFSS